MSGPLLELAAVSVRLGSRTVVRDVSLAVMPGGLVVIAGANGAGKTTLLRAAAGLIPADGTIRLGGEPVGRLRSAERARRLAYLPQGHAIHWPLRVDEVVALGRLPHGAGADLSAADQAAVARAIAATGIGPYAARAVTTLSGGERARVALARVLATEAPLVLADEPTASLDPRYQVIVMDILRSQASAGGAVVAVLHDLALAARYADRIVLLDQGEVIADGPPRDVLTPARLAAAFGIDATVTEVAGAPVVVTVGVRPG